MDPSRSDLPSSASRPVHADHTATSSRLAVGQTCLLAFSHQIVDSTSLQKKTVSPCSESRRTYLSSRAGIVCRSAGHDGLAPYCRPSRCLDLSGGRSNRRRDCAKWPTRLSRRTQGHRAWRIRCPIPPPFISRPHLPLLHVMTSRSLCHLAHLSTDREVYPSVFDYHPCPP